MKKFIILLLAMSVMCSPVFAQQKLRSVQLLDSLHIALVHVSDGNIDTLTITDSLNINSLEIIPFVVSTTFGGTKAKVDSFGTMTIVGAYLSSATTPIDWIMDNSTTGADGDPGRMIFRGNDGAADTELEMSVSLEITTTTDYEYGWYDDSETQVGSIDQSGNFQADGTGTFGGAIGMESLVVTPTSVGTKLDFELETEWTGGTLIRADFGGGTTATDDIVYQLADFSANFTFLTNKDITGYQIKMPAVTESAANTTNFIGFDLASAGALVNTNGTLNWNGMNIVMPAITQTSGTIVSTGLKITDGAVTTAGTQYGIDISAGTGTGTTNAIRIGATWDLGINDASGITTIGAFTSVGIDDNADATAITIDITTEKVNMSADCDVVSDFTAGTIATTTGTFTDEVDITKSTAGTALDVNYTATTYTTVLGAVDVVRSGALTGVNTESIIDVNVVPSFTLTEPGAGTFNYWGANIDLSNIAVTAGVGTSVLSALYLVANADGDVGTNYALFVDAGNVKFDDNLLFDTGSVLSWNATDLMTHSANTMTLAGFTTWDMGAVTTFDFNGAASFTSAAGGWTMDGTLQIDAIQDVGNDATLSFSGTNGVDVVNALTAGSVGSDDAITGQTLELTPTATGNLIEMNLETEWTTGIAMYGNFGGATTLSADISGTFYDFETNVTTVAKDIHGFYVKLPAQTNTGDDAHVSTGFWVSGGAVDQGAGTGPTTWSGVNVEMPDITQTAGTVTSYGVYVVGGTVTSGTEYGLYVSSANTYLDGTLETTGAFTSLGIDDNASATAITISVDEDVTIGAGSLTITELTATAAVFTMEADASEDAGDTWTITVVDGDGQNFASSAGNWLAVTGSTLAADFPGALSCASLSSDATIVATTNITAGVAGSSEVQPIFSIIGDADSDADDTDETLSVTLTDTPDPTDATWGWSTTQSAGMDFNMPITVTSVTADARVGGLGFTNTGTDIRTPSDASYLAAATITIIDAYQRVAGDGAARTLTSTPSIADGTDGQVVILQGYDDTNTLTLQDESNLAGSGLELDGDVNATLGENDILMLVFDSGEDAWLEISRSNNNDD